MPLKEGSEQELLKIDGMEGSRSAGARLASCVEGSQATTIDSGATAHTDASHPGCDPVARVIASRTVYSFLFIAFI